MKLSIGSHPNMATRVVGRLSLISKSNKRPCVEHELSVARPGAPKPSWCYCYYYYYFCQQQSGFRRPAAHAVQRRMSELCSASCDVEVFPSHVRRYQRGPWNPSQHSSEGSSEIGTPRRTSYSLPLGCTPLDRSIRDNESH